MLGRVGNFSWTHLQVNLILIAVRLFLTSIFVLFNLMLTWLELRWVQLSREQGICLYLCGWILILQLSLLNSLICLDLLYLLFSLFFNNSLLLFSLIYLMNYRLCILLWIHVYTNQFNKYLNNKFISNTIYLTLILFIPIDSKLHINIQITPSAVTCLPDHSYELLVT